MSRKLPENINLPQIEDEVREFWDANDNTMNSSLKLSHPQSSKVYDSSNQRFVERFKPPIKLKQRKKFIGFKHSPAVVIPAQAGIQTRQANSAPQL